MKKDNTGTNQYLTNKKKLNNQSDELSLSQWQLMWRAYKKHKLARSATVIILLFYLIAIGCGFFVPNDPHQRWSEYVFVPPQLPQFIDEEGNLHFRPFIYGLKQEMDPVTWTRTYVQNENKKYPIYFFTKGFTYQLGGLLETNIHLFNTKHMPFFLFGSDELGQNLYSRIIYGTRISLSIGLIGVFISLILGLLIGGISGFFGGSVDIIIQRGIEILISIPRIPLWMALSAALPSEWPPIKVYFAITLLLSLVGWVNVARVVRGKFLSLRGEDFVIASEAMGANYLWIIVRHLIPNFISFVFVQLTLAIPIMIIGETALSFLGIGLRPPVISWGVLLKKAQNIRTVSMHPWLLLPGIFVILAVLMFNFVGDGLRDAADPYSN